MSEFEKRLQAILDRQSLFNAALIDLQRELFQLLAESRAVLATNSAYFDKVLLYFQQKLHLPLLQSMADDLQFIVNSNVLYFSLQVSETDVVSALGEVTIAIKEQFGLTGAGQIAQSGLLSDVLKDTSIKRDVRNYLIKNIRSGGSTKQGLKEYINGNESSLGILESYYRRTDRNGLALYDVYQQADRMAQNTFADSLGLQSAIYTGGLIETSRPICQELNRKIKIRSEIDALKERSFAGKPKFNYDPFSQCGGHRCRHVWSWIGNSTALRLDPTLKLVDGKIIRVS